MAKEHLYSSTDLPQRTAQVVAAKMIQAIAARGRCYCALSGGSSPEPMLQALADQTLPWEKVVLLMVDERLTDDASAQNQTMLNRFIERIPGSKPQLITLFENEPPDKACIMANHKVSDCPTQLDIIVLGMGMDGHTASLFPDAKEYQTAMGCKDRYVTVMPTEAPYQRLSMSFHWISQALELLLYIPGADKLHCFHSITSSADSISPINTLNAQCPQLSVYSSKD